MFKKGDWFWFVARIVFIVINVLAVIASFVYPIVYAVLQENWLFMLFAIPSLIGCFVFWVFWNLFLTYLCDVKLIRNKLYDEGNEAFDVFLMEKDNLRAERKMNLRAERKMDEKERAETEKAIAMHLQLKNLQRKLSTGEITAEEFEKLKKELMEENTTATTQNGATCTDGAKEPHEKPREEKSSETREENNKKENTMKQDREGIESLIQEETKKSGTDPKIKREIDYLSKLLNLGAISEQEYKRRIRILKSGKTYHEYED